MNLNYCGIEDQVTFIINSYLKTHGITKQYFCDACQIAKLKRCHHNKKTPKAKDIYENVGFLH